jgi:hypothetical protein
VPDKKTWQKERVFRDILEHRMTKFSNGQQQQWHALHQFHELYQTADAVPPLPISLQSPDGTSFTMEHGSPFDWDTAWSNLAWRFDRPHKPRPTSEAPAGSSTDDAGSTSKDGQLEEPSKPQQRDPAILNGATGGNAKKSKKKQAVRSESVEDKAKALPAKGMEMVAAKALHFVVSPAPDGELSVGLVRIEQAEAETVDIAWWERVGDSERWPDCPTFKPFMPKGKVEKQAKVDQEALLAVPVELTKTSKANYNPNAKSIAGQKVRLTKACMTLLRTFLRIHRSDLINPINSSSGEDDEGSDESGEDVEE